MNRLLAPLLALAITALALIAPDLRDTVWDGWQTYRSPYLQPLPTGEVSRPVTRRLVVVLVRGLRERDARDMPTLRVLRGRGADITLQHSGPVWRIPVWLTLFSGAETDVHGVTTNNAARSAALDTVFTRVDAAGLQQVLIGSPELVDAFGPSFQNAATISEPDAAAQTDIVQTTLLHQLRDPNTNAALIVAELTLIEDTLRQAPGALSSAVAATDIRLNAIAGACDLANTTLVIMSDRGLTDFGEDGGLQDDIARVPVVLAGAGIKPGVQTVARAGQLAPTLTALLGVPPPSHNQRAPLFEVLSQPVYSPSARQLTTFYESWSESARVPRFAAERLRAHEVAIEAGDARAFAQFEAGVLQDLSERRETRLAGERLTRLPLAAGAALLMLVTAVWVLNSHAAPALTALLVYLGGWQLLFSVIRARLVSLSMYPNGAPLPFLDQVTADTVIALLIAVLTASIVAARTCESLGDALTAVIGGMALCAISALVQFGWFVWRWGDRFTDSLPPVDALANALLMTAQMGAFAASVLPVLPPVPIVLAGALICTLVWWVTPGLRKR
jgi:hypothetical protein